MTIDDVNLSERLRSSYDDEDWQYYSIGDFTGVCLVRCAEDDIAGVKQECLDAYNSFELHPHFDELTAPLAELITNLYLSNNDMWFVDEDDEWLVGVDLEALEAEVNWYGLGDCITFYDNDAVICLYSSAQEIINLN